MLGTRPRAPPRPRLHPAPVLGSPTTQALPHSLQCPGMYPGRPRSCPMSRMMGSSHDGHGFGGGGLAPAPPAPQATRIPAPAIVAATRSLFIDVSSFRNCGRRSLARRQRHSCRKAPDYRAFGIGPEVVEGAAKRELSCRSNGRRAATPPCRGRVEIVYARLQLTDIEESAVRAAAVLAVGQAFDVADRLELTFDDSWTVRATRFPPSVCSAQCRRPRRRRVRPAWEVSVRSFRRVVVRVRQGMRRRVR